MELENFFVKVKEITDIQPHPNADALELAIVEGWQVVVKIGQFHKGDIALHIPPNALVPQEVSDAWGVTQYLSKGRVRVVKLRGEPSYGFLVENDTNAAVGTDLKNYYEITEWEPPEKFFGGDVEKPHSYFEFYPSMQNLYNFPDIPNGEVICLEKIHGTNSAIGMVLENDERVTLVGSRKLLRKRGKDSIYERPYLRFQEDMDGLLNTLFDNPQEYIPSLSPELVRSVIIYGEIYGSGVQNLQYGYNGQTVYAAFDIAINGKFLSFDDCVKLFNEYGIPMAPILYRGEYSFNKIQEVACGNTTLMDGDAHIREGVVMKPVVEQAHPKIGRVIFKCKNPDYELL